MKYFLNRFANLVEEVSFGVGLNFIDLVELFIRFFGHEFASIDGFDDDAIGNSFPSGEAAAIVFDYPHNVVRLEPVVDFMAEGDNDGVVNVIEILGIEPANKLLQFVLDGFFGHLFEDERGLRQHRDGFERVRELHFVLDWLYQGLHRD